MSSSVKGLCKILFIGSLVTVMGGSCSLLNKKKPEENKEKEIVEKVFIYRFNRKIVTITGPFRTKKEKDYISFSEIPKDKEEELKPILYLKENTRSFYIDCQRNGFNATTYPLNRGLKMGFIKPKRTYDVDKICKLIGEY